MKVTALTCLLLLSGALASAKAVDAPVTFAIGGQNVPNVVTAQATDAAVVTPVAYRPYRGYYRPYYGYRPYVRPYVAPYYGYGPYYRPYYAPYRGYYRGPGVYFGW
jgi:hypothetical protein